MNQTTEIQNVIYTIGHGNRRIEELIRLLNQNSINLLIDVRSFPYSRFHPQYRQANLKASLEEAGFTYLWLGNELGGRPKDPALYLNGNPSYLTMKNTHSFEVGIDQILKLFKDGITVALMCSESDQNECHRKHLISAELVKRGATVLHINKVGSIENELSIGNLFE